MYHNIDNDEETGELRIDFRGANPEDKATNLDIFHLTMSMIRARVAFGAKVDHNELVKRVFSQDADIPADLLAVIDQFLSTEDLFVYDNMNTFIDS